MTQRASKADKLETTAADTGKLGTTLQLEPPVTPAGETVVTDPETTTTTVVETQTTTTTTTETNDDTTDADKLEPFEVWAERAGTPSDTLAGVVYQQQWPVGREMKRADFDAAVTAFLETPVG
jgi:hypothetical protein